MWFKNMQMYRLSRSLDWSELNKALLGARFTPLGSHERSRFGWIEPFGPQPDADPDAEPLLVHCANGQLRLVAKKEEKVIPPAALTEKAKPRITALEAELGRPLGKKEIGAIKDDVLQSMLPHAFSRVTFTQIWISPANNLIVVDAASGSGADAVLALLRKCLGSLPAVPVCMKTPLEVTMTNWLKERELPNGFQSKYSAQLVSCLDKEKITFTNADLYADEVNAHLTRDMVVTRITLGWQDKLEFILNDSLTLKGIAFEDEVRMGEEDVDDENPYAQLDADFVLWAGLMLEFIPALFEALGGEEPRAN